MELQETDKLSEDASKDVEWSKLKEEKCKIRDEYMLNVNNKMANTNHHFKQSQGELAEAKDKVSSGKSGFL